MAISETKKYGKKEIKTKNNTGIAQKKRSR